MAVEAINKHVDLSKDTVLCRWAWEHKRNQINRCLLHDLSNQWGGVLTLSELYSQNPQSESLVEGLKLIRDSAQKGRAILTRLSRLNYPSDRQNDT